MKLCLAASSTSSAGASPASNGLERQLLQRQSRLWRKISLLDVEIFWKMVTRDRGADTLQVIKSRCILRENVLIHSHARRLNSGTTLDHVCCLCLTHVAGQDIEALLAFGLSWRR